MNNNRWPRTQSLDRLHWEVNKGVVLSVFPCVHPLKSKADMPAAQDLQGVNCRITLGGCEYDCHWRASSGDLLEEIPVRLSIRQSAQN